MKLGDAKLELGVVLSKIAELESFLIRTDSDKLMELLDSMSQLLEAKQLLMRNIKEAELRATVGGNSLAEVLEAKLLLEDKIRVMEILAAREDLNPTQQEAVSKQLSNYRGTRHTLISSIQKCIWDTALLDE